MKRIRFESRWFLSTVCFRIGRNEQPSLKTLDAANGSDMFERINDEEGVKSDSRFNENEAELVKAHLQKLIASGISPAHISIISPYQAQVSLLSNSIKKERPEIEIGSVDGFQGLCCLLH